jgi:hypothetical protein
MTVGPVQFMAFGFDSTDRMRGQVVDELWRLRGRGIIRVLDLLLVSKLDNGDLVVIDVEEDLNAEAAEGDADAYELGLLLGPLVGFDTGRQSSGAIDEPAGAAQGLGPDELDYLAESLPVGTAVGLLLIEHTWAKGLSGAIRDAGGAPMMQGFLTPEAMLMIGAETIAIAEAANAIEPAAILEGAAALASLEAIAVIEGLDTGVSTAVAAKTLATLIDAGLLEGEDAPEAIEALIEVGLITP